MHENRETPSPTVSESGSPAGEGESRTSGMHSSGESDGAVVPMKPSNKATGQARGSGEGGGKGANQGERPAGTRGSGTARSSRVTGSEGRAESGQAALCRYPSKVRAVCVNRARTDPCGGCEATRIPTATAPFVVLDRRHKPIVCPTLLVLVKVSAAGESSK